MCRTIEKKGALAMPTQKALVLASKGNKCREMTLGVGPEVTFVVEQQQPSSFTELDYLGLEQLLSTQSEGSLGVRGSCSAQTPWEITELEGGLTPSTNGQHDNGRLQATGDDFAVPRYSVTSDFDPLLDLEDALTSSSLTTSPDFSASHFFPQPFGSPEYNDSLREYEDQQNFHSLDFEFGSHSELEETDSERCASIIPPNYTVHDKDLEELSKLPSVDEQPLKKSLKKSKAEKRSVTTKTMKAPRVGQKKPTQGRRLVSEMEPEELERVREMNRAAAKRHRELIRIKDQFGVERFNAITKENAQLSVEAKRLQEELAMLKNVLLAKYKNKTLLLP